MNELALIDKTKPEEVLARLHSRNPAFVSDLYRQINACMQLKIDRWGGERALERALDEAQHTIAALPADEDVAALAKAVEEALTKSTEAFTQRQVGLLIGAFPNANPTDPKIYSSAMVFDLLDTRVPDAILLLACQELRRAQSFIPTIAEVLQAAKRHQDIWREALKLPERLTRAREIAQAAVKSGEDALAELRSAPAKKIKGAA